MVSRGHRLRRPQRGVNPNAEEVCGNGVDENCRDDVRECTDGDAPCDADADGYLAMHAEIEGCGQDCDDAVAAVNPAAFEGTAPTRRPGDQPGCDDGVDNNCDGRVDERCSSDLDDDGVERGVDCNDCNAAVGPTSRGLQQRNRRGLRRRRRRPALQRQRRGRRRFPVGGRRRHDCDDTDPAVHGGPPTTAETA